MSNLKRYSILVVEGGASEKELCGVDSKPEDIVAALQKQTRPMGKRRVQKYANVRFVDNLAPPAARKRPAADVGHPFNKWW